MVGNKLNFIKLYFWSAAYTFRYLSQSRNRMVAICESRKRLGSNSDYKVGNKFQNAPIAPPVTEVIRC